MQVFGHYVLGQRVRLFLAEQAAVSVVFLAALASGGRAGPSALLVAVGCAAAMQVAFYLADLYDPEVFRSPSRWLMGAGASALLATAVWSRVASAPPGFWLAALALASTVSLLLRGLVLVPPQRVLVIGTGPKARAAARLLATLPGCEPVGYVPDASFDDGAPSSLPILLDLDGDLPALCRRMNAGLMVVASEGPLPEESLACSRAAGVEVVSAAGLAARHFRRIPAELLGPAELVFGEGFHASRMTDRVQRGLDLGCSAALLLLSSPVLLLAMLAVRLDSPGPIFYSQERVGRGGRVFRVVKLRSMRVDAEAAHAPVWAKVNDPRVTRVGSFLRKARIDELPQLFAVLAGRMSLVGPRPERPFFVEQLKRELPLYGLREMVRPGVTGWAQISCPYGATLEDARRKLEYDLYYIRHRSIFLDLCVLFHTARTVLTARGAR